MCSHYQRHSALSFLVLFFSVRFLAVNCQDSKVKCGHPFVPLNTRVKLSSPNLEVGTVATYLCDEGYETFGDTNLTCSPSGRWEGEIPFCGVNVAYRKPANQSTTVRGGTALNANDGDKSTEHDGKRCSETFKETSPWWQVDLLKPYPVKLIRITTRGCCGHQPLQDLEIRVGNSSSDLQKNPLCAWFPGTVDEGVSKTFSCARTLVGQYVFIQLVGVEGSLSLCEVEVFSTDELPTARCAPQNVPDTSQLIIFSEMCYKFSAGKGSSFSGARSSCKKENGDLIHSMNTPQTSFLISQLDRRKSNLTTQLVWIGAQKEPGVISRTWKWVNGDVVNKPHWGKDQPNNYNGEQNCVVLDGGRDWLWNDVGCNLDYLSWICQHEPLFCGSPDKLMNTTITGLDYKVGSVIEYHCPEGHRLIGDKKRKCNSNGFWSGSPPTCKYVDCGGLKDLEHGVISLENSKTTYGSKAIYSCHENYTLVGHEVRVCGDDGQWSNAPPQCLFDWCPDPPPVHGGTVITTGHRTGNTAKYECYPGHIISGDEVISCNLGGIWSGKAPTCKYVDCGSPPNIDYGKYTLKNGTTTVGSTAQYSCIEDYWLSGELNLKCTREGKWSSDAPSCELITCEEPEVPVGSYVIGYDFNIHSTIEYHCEAGYLLTGEASHECGSTGEWSGSIPNCEFIDCGKVTSVPKGNIEYLNGTTYLNSILQISCSENYKLVGDSTRTCQTNKQWSGVHPRCEEIRCPEPVIAPHSILSVTGNDRIYGRTLIRTAESANVGATSYKIGALLKYRCERGYKIVGEPLSTCEDTGAWSGSVPTCVFVDCGNPEEVENGQVMLPSNATYYGVLALYTCNENFELHGVSRRLCLENGTWSSTLPQCKEIECGKPETTDDLTYKVRSFKIGGVVEYQCPKGYTLQGNATRMCTKKGVWGGTIPSCKAVDCGDPGTMEHGRIIIVNGTTYNKGIEYHCIPGFRRIGPFLRKCMENGEWSGEKASCEVAEEIPLENFNVGTSIGIGAAVIVFLLIIVGLIYLKLRKPVPVKNTENVEGAERKEDRNAAVMSYATLSDRNSYHSTMNNTYENIHDENLYDSPYGDAKEYSGEYEPEPRGKTTDETITINGVAVR